MCILKRHCIAYWKGPYKSTNWYAYIHVCVMHARLYSSYACINQSICNQNSHATNASVLILFIFLPSSPQKDWRDLARKLGLDKYIQLLESRTPHSTRLLLLKWGEKPRWTVDSLLYALKGIGRVDVANFIRARMGLTKK